MNKNVHWSKRWLLFLITFSPLQCVFIPVKLGKECILNIPSFWFQGKVVAGRVTIRNPVFSLGISKHSCEGLDALQIHQGVGSPQTAALGSSVCDSNFLTTASRPAAHSWQPLPTQELGLSFYFPRKAETNLYILLNRIYFIKVWWSIKGLHPRKEKAEKCISDTSEPRVILNSLSQGSLCAPLSS